MTLVNLAQLLVLAALWGASFLFIRISVTDFGVAPLMALRVGIGALFILIVLVTRRSSRGSAREAFPTMRARAGPLLVVGLLNPARAVFLFRIADSPVSRWVRS